MKVSLVFAMILAAAGPTDAADWPCWRGPNHTGISVERDWRDQFPPEGPTVLWRSQVGTGFSSVVVRDDMLVTMGNRDNVDTISCLDTGTGQTRWSKSYPSPIDDRFFEGGPTSTPTIDGDRIYAQGRQGELHCLNLATGAVHWLVNVHELSDARIPGWGFSGSPVVVDDRLLLNVGGAGLALDKKNGQVLWQSDRAEAGYATPLVFSRGDRQLALIASSKFYSAVDVQSGELLWQHRWLTRFGANAADPIVQSDLIFLSSGYNRGAALLRWNDESPEVVWKNKDLQNQISSSVLLGEHLYGFDGDTTSETSLKCLDVASGAVVWSEPWQGMGSLMAADGKLIILSERGELSIAAADPDAYRPSARASVLDGKCWTVPVLAHGRIYCRSADGQVVCVDVRPEGWPP